MSIYERTERLIGAEALEKLKKARIAVFGIGGVGSYAVEALARAGIGALDLIDADQVSESNINRQLIALRSTVGMDKVAVAKERIADINPECIVLTYPILYLPETASRFDFSVYDYVVDAIDSVTGKLSLIEECKRSGIPIISCMGTGNKLHPELLQISDIEKTSVCPLARVMRREARKKGLGHFDVLFSTEEPHEAVKDTSPDPSSVIRKRSAPASISFVPSVAGLLIAGHVIRSVAGLTESYRRKPFD